MIISIIVWLLCLCGFGLMYIYSPSTLTLLMLITTAFLPIMSIVFAAIASRFLSIAFEAPEVISKGKANQIKIKVISKTSLPLSKVKVRLHLQNCLTDEVLEKKVVLPVRARGEETTTLEFEGSVCGFIECKIVETRVVDFFNLSSFKINNNGNKEMVIVPETFDLSLKSPGSVALMEESDQYSQEKPGYDYSEVFQVRDYVEGDSPKQIHWKLTSKFDRLISKDPSLPMEKSILVFWERSSLDGKENIIVADAMVEILISLIREIISMGVSCRLVWNDENGDHYNDITLFTEDDLYSIIPRLLKARCVGTVSGVDAFNRLNKVQISGNVVYLGSYEAYGLEDLAKGNNLIKLVEGETFNKETYTEDLREISFY